MKRFACLLVALGIVVGLGCRRSQPAPQSAPVAPAAEPVAAAPAASPVPTVVETVADLADYPEATKVSFSTKVDAGHGWAKVTEAKFTSTAAYQAVFDFYQKAIADKGWTVTAHEGKPGKAEWKLSKATSVAQVELDQESARVEIKLERRDR